ncbi:hypothetical protein ACFX1X_004337 [Malus domestica]
MASPPTAGMPEISEILLPSSSLKEYLYVQYGGQSYAAFKVSWSFLISELNQAKKLQETLNVAALVIPYGCCSIL